MNILDEYKAFLATHPVASVGKYSLWAICGALKLLVLYAALSALIQAWLLKVTEAVYPNWSWLSAALSTFANGLPIAVVLGGVLGAITAWVVKPWDDLSWLDENCCENEMCEGECMPGTVADEAIVVASEVPPQA